MKILGIDPGLASIGVALIDWAPHGKSTVLALKTITTPPGPTQPRVEQVVAELDPYFENVEAAALEEQERAWQGKQQRKQTNSKATLARVGEGSIRTLAAKRKVPVIELLPARTRASLGLAGNCDKQLLLTAIKGLYRIQGKHSSHALDALALAHAAGARWSILRQRPGALTPR